MKAAEEGKTNQQLLQEEVLEQQRESEPGPTVDLGFVAEAMNRRNGRGPAALARGARQLHRAEESPLRSWPRKFEPNTRRTGSRESSS
jgi:hypothetical protein